MVHFFLECLDDKNGEVLLRCLADILYPFLISFIVLGDHKGRNSERTGQKK